MAIYRTGGSELLAPISPTTIGDLLLVRFGDLLRPPQGFAGKADAPCFEIAAIVPRTVQRVAQHHLGIVAIAAPVGLDLRR